MKLFCILSTILIANSSAFAAESCGKLKKISRVDTYDIELELDNGSNKTIDTGGMESRMAMLTTAMAGGLTVCIGEDGEINSIVK